MAIKNFFKTWGLSLLISAGVFYYFWTQFAEAQRSTPFFLNKAIAETSIILIGLSFLLGPLCKILPFLRRFIYLRRYFGLEGFFLVLLHIGASLWQFSTRFPLSWYVSHIWGVAAAVVATLIFLVLAVTSFRRAIQMLGGKNWKTVQRTGYIALFLALIHIYVAASPRWQMWWDGKVDMPSSFVVFAFGVIVIVARLLALVADQFDKPKTATSGLKK